jgi:CMP-N,N'-diacetyllegionaminic acid synthase
MKLTSVAFIPARSGSKRIPEKNIKNLGGHPLIAYSIRSAIDSGVFDKVICATDDEKYAEIAKYYGAEVPFLRGAETSGDKSPDIKWVQWALESLKDSNLNFNIFSILRPTNPFRKAETIKRAWMSFIEEKAVDSLRAVEKCKQHPGKMWVVNGNRMLPLMPFKIDDTPWHSSQYANLPEIHVQNASLEISWTRNVLENKSIAGELVMPFLTNEIEGFDINEPEDIILAELYIAQDKSILPEISIREFKI